MLKLELVLPCYNEGEGLSNLIQRAIDTATRYHHTPESFQLVLVENGSTDNSAQILEILKNTPQGKWFRIVPILKNQGYGYGIYQGLKSTTAPIIAWSHADHQCDPADAFKAFEILQKEQTPKVLIKGERFGRNWKDRLVSRVFETFSRMILGLKVYELNAQPKVFARTLIDQTDLSPPKTFAFDLYLLYRAQKAGYQIKTIPVEFPPRIHGASKWASNFFSRYKTILGMIRYMFELRKKEGRL